MVISSSGWCGPTTGRCSKGTGWGLQGQSQEERSTGHHRGNQRRAGQDSWSSSQSGGSRASTASLWGTQSTVALLQHPSAPGILAGQGTQHTASSWAQSLELAEKATLVPKMIQPVGHFPKDHNGKAGVLHTPMWIKAGGELQTQDSTALGFHMPRQEKKSHITTKRK